MRRGFALSFTPSYQKDDRDPGEKLRPLLEGLGRWLFWPGLIGTLAGFGLTVFTFQAAATGGGAPDIVANNLHVYNSLLIIGVVALMLGSSLAWWGEDALAASQTIGAAIVFFSPLYLPMVFGVSEVGEAGARALQVLQDAGAAFGILALGVLVVDVAQRVRQRSMVGTKADHLKYGKGLREEKEYQDVFLGKCWQMPFCRKFVRQLCPIYHAQRTCWKERVGCMCEEEVIRRAMQGQIEGTISKDALAAAKFIPKNFKLTEEQKKERCRQCVIYNEHQKHKYRLLVPMTILVFIGLYVGGRAIFLGVTTDMVNRVDRMVANVLLQQGPSGIAEKARTSVIPLNELMLASFFLLAFVYALKLVEFAVFKLKI